MSYEEGVAHLRKVLKNDDDIAIFSAFLAFNRSILKTNFYRSEIVSLAFRLDPSGFLSGDYADNLPHGIFMMVSAEARGFHCRFADIARGGIRLIKSASPQAYSANVGGLFDECYSLAATQHLKNKDIVESGSECAQGQRGLGTQQAGTAGRGGAAGRPAVA
jgi:glutamate dehydrogenase